MAVAAAQASADPSEAAIESIRPEAFRACVNFLPDGLPEGRGANSRGYEIAANYMATEI